MRCAPLVLSFTALLALNSCQTLQEMGRSIDQIGASLVRSLITPPSPAKDKVEITQSLPPEFAERRAAGELRAVAVVSQPTLTAPAGDLLRVTAVPAQDEPLVILTEEANADAWFAAVPERVAEAAGLADSDLLVAAHLHTRAFTSESGEARRELRLELRAYDRAAQAWVFAARATADDPVQGGLETFPRVAQLARALASRMQSP